MSEAEGAEVVLSDAEQATLAAICDTIVPSIERPRDPDGLWARKATDLGVDVAAAQLISEIPEPAMRDGLRQLIAAIGAQGIAGASQPSREQILRNIGLSGPEAAAGVAALTQMTLFLTYGAPDPETGQNPNWRTFGFPGPVSAPPDVPKTLRLHEPEGSEETLEADAVIVGSGAGGSVIAAALAARGLDVVVLEAAGYFNESDFSQLELPAYQQMFWRGGPTPTAEGNVTLQAGTTLGGGTTINWTNCLRTKPWVREQWAGEFGLDGVDGPEFDAHLDAVWERLGVNADTSDLNGPQQRMQEGCEALGWSFSKITRNSDPSGYAPESAAYMGFGDQSGSKQSADRTWLADAQAGGAKLLAHTRVQKVLVEDGRAAGVEAQWATPDGRGASVTVRAPRVVVAAGSLESPALLARSEIGGPSGRPEPQAASVHRRARCLRIRPGGLVGAAAGGPLRRVRGQGDGYGMLIETGQYAPGLVGSASPWISAADHKERMENFRFGATFISLTRDHGAGTVMTDADGEAIPLYSVTDERDVTNLRKGLDVQARLHEAAGAHTIVGLAGSAPTWRRGDDFEGFVAGIQRIPFRAGGHKMFSAHQMGTCRMGPDPSASVADPRGELHDTPGVWIGDASAFPTPSGTNPMITIMALARRTAEAIAADAGAGASAEEHEEVTVGN